MFAENLMEIHVLARNSAPKSTDFANDLHNSICTPDRSKVIYSILLQILCFPLPDVLSLRLRTRIHIWRLAETVCSEAGLNKRSVRLLDVDETLKDV